MLRFHLHIHPLADEAPSGEPLLVNGEEIATLAVPAEALRQPLAVTFDEALAALAELPRLYTEPDGSILYSGAEQGGWSVEGQLTDAGPRLASLELKGRCPPEALDRVLSTLGWPAEPLMFQLAREAVFLEEASLRRYGTLQEAAAQAGD